MVPTEAVTGHDVDEIAGWIIQLISFQINSHLAIAYYYDKEDDMRTFIEELLPSHNVQASIEQLTWVKENWLGSISLTKDSNFLFALKTFFSHHLIQSTELRIISVWAVLERIFSAKGGELRFRVSANIAAYLEPRGPARRELFRSTLNLYDERSSAAHGTALKSNDAEKNSLSLARRALAKIIENRHVPSPEELEVMLFE